MSARQFRSDELRPTLPAAAYLSEPVFAQEREKIFFREWTCIAREHEVPQAGDYLIVRLLGETLLLVRDRGGTLRAHFNVCAHRGCELVSCPPGEAPHAGTGKFPGGIRCPYHSWTYELDGSLRGAPFLEFTPQAPKSAFHLQTVPLEVWGGFVFVNVDGLAPGAGHSLQSQVGAAAERLSHYPLAALRRGARRVYSVHANWKVLAENYNECYHCGSVHPELCELVPAFKSHGGAALDWERGIPHRSGAWTFTATGTSTRAPFPALSPDERVRHKGEVCYPNLWLSLAADHVTAFLLLPRHAGLTDIVCDFLFDAKEVARPGFDPSDVVDFWDLVNRQDWGVCESVQRGMSSRGFVAGHFSPMEDPSADIAAYVGERLNR